ncbi:beta-ketoacyl synthase N-terminal-like domain-containing protein [Paenibacillus sp. FJAT-26967]|uniref:type I polyketide synthase n=1 Tax=Paenibacillus sp. FJAT-26967 TaxID=1729690 RepID=UPI0008398A0E|nr:polyketide synthase [Paenibacillus sp. FJAT-26967]
MQTQKQQIVLKLVADKKITPQEAAVLLSGQGAAAKEAPDHQIAIIGMSGKFPGASNLEQFWNNLHDGVKSIGPFPSGRRKDTDPYIARMGEPDNVYGLGGFLEEVDKFDASFFRISPSEARTMDPLQRLYLETAWECIEEAGYSAQNIHGSATGVFVGNDHAFGQTYKQMLPEEAPFALTGSYTSILASRISYALNLRGPALVVDTACSSGLSAVHLACQSLIGKECQMAIAGGVYLRLLPLQMSSMQTVETESADVRAFDRYADGTVWGEGMGAVLLKPLKQALLDGDHIHAVIKGSSMNNDGLTNGITAPSPDAQHDVLLAAWNQAGISPDTLGYIEAHGTGTVLGDPLEIKAISRAMSKFTNRKQFCGIGSLKPNVGHLVSASGIASLLKVVLALKHKQIPASLNFREPNPYIPFTDTPVYINDKLTTWHKQENPRRAGISCFGFSGTNSHMVLEEAPLLPLRDSSAVSTVRHLFTLSAKSMSSLQASLHNYSRFLRENRQLHVSDICYTLAVCKDHHPYRIALVVRDNDELTDLLAEFGTNLANHLEKPGQSRLFFGYHKLVTENRTLLEPGDLNKTEKDRLSRRANELFRRLKAEDRAAESGILDEIARQYVSGADVDWNFVYGGLYRKGRKVSVPVYPLERHRFWVQGSESLPAAYDSPHIDQPVQAHHLIDVTLTGKLQGEAYTETEKMIAGVWGRLLELDSIHIEDNFFELGGNSILSLELEVELDKCGINLDFESVNRYPTIKELAHYAESLKMDAN